MKKLVLAVAVLLVVAGYCSAAEKGLVLHFKFDEGSGDTVKDASGSGLEGTVNGEVSWGEGVSGKAISFDGTSFVDVPYDDRLAPEKLVTILAWINPTDYEFDSYKNIVICWDSYILRYDNPPEGGKFSFFIFLEGSPEPRVQMDAPALKKWHLVAGMWDGKQSHVYIDGKKQSVDRPGAPAPKENTFHIGEGYVGAIDELKIYNRVLTDDELKAVLAAGPKAK
ncbi:hypothetical protein COY52_10055 [Candidatus Desantisbacteria bacterium CG_4_10_14_0_8_um_filter_48_22]|uniref:LamG-like jellyroll fold domain-containing protein n=1 Tax=Candidatus Desantisbacteria bacterium CG_4_10_14_0_8_um_filter_48_22 TaxID=1974543 RepID=A0A2M7S761_9BACT|nr:MAG: hypothetical protein AUJ67_07795 [Candidatus Desantisbacteria bacterium CG1_02_49_89]PIV56309.1 MAG: hypothetical protein COS16_04440 [Candidatus Desantisbacteria bacterium CG02_land_8_20_14_3_00_49_13]PIZ15334.1 MAG: hypothetical protein COY52_10055 [Candidatus Desantisbacteria bacterium CG_4_10_14_0_8_um_filter_48_22]